jgi:hypothetical protein
MAHMTRGVIMSLTRSLDGVAGRLDEASAVLSGESGTTVAPG